MDIETDVDTFLAGEEDRLRVIPATLRGIAGDTGGEGVESKVLHASAGELEAVARGLDAVRGHLCRTCKVLEVEESLRIDGKYRGRGVCGSRPVVVVGRVLADPKLRRSGAGGAAFLKMRLGIARHGE
ncbi:MAG: hypothetical protein HY716_05390 [Planctomycetes bacterium]|nr:hypothetical protein [Planctomycetota bacterium]